MTSNAPTIADSLHAAGVSDVRPEYPLAALTTLRVGGPARVFVSADDEVALRAISRVCRDLDVPWIVIGRGSNLLVSDEGFPGIAVQLGRGWRGVDIVEDHVIAGGAEPLPTLAQRVADGGLSGFSWGAAVPGTLGGAVRMNAGAHGGQIADHLRWADVVDMSQAHSRRIDASEFSFGYRTSGLPEDVIVVRARLDLIRADAATVRQEIADIRAWRRVHQPLNEPNCGSVFVNPDAASAGMLIETAGCKGMTVGGASVSARHANFVVTRPGATAADVHALIIAVQRRVAEHSGVLLATEVVMVGDFGPDTPTVERRQ
ncbi:MAG: UDP-N-acetylmuramate dehydrogenase [Nitriliruptoraceae bacterium]